jgi:hypothetical protein
VEKELRMSGEPVLGRAAIGCLCLAMAAVWATGCTPDAPGPLPRPQSEPATPDKVVAVEPFDMAESVSTLPTFKWKLPPSIAMPTTVTFSLSAAGQVDAPIRDADVLEKNEVAIISGLAGSSPTSLELFHPPGECVATWIKRAKPTQLKGMTWYRWTVLATGPGDLGPVSTVRGSEFFFRTRTPDLPDLLVPTATAGKSATAGKTATTATKKP